MEGDRRVTLIEPGEPPIRHEAWATRNDRGGSESVQAETQVGSWTIRWRVRQVGLENLDHTWSLVDAYTNQPHDIEALRDIDRRFWEIFTIRKIMSLDPIADFRAIADDIVGADNVHEIVQPSKLVDRHREFAFPSIVFSVIADETISTLRGGPFRSATALRYETRSKDPDEARTISAQILTALRRAGKLQQMLGVLDDFDDDLGIYRRIQSIMLI